MKLPVADITELIPQKPPFVMVDQLIFVDEEITRTTFTVQADNVLTENGVFSEAGLIENIAQTAAAGAGYKAMQQNEPVKAGFIGAIKDLEIFGLPKIGQLLETEVHIENQVFNVTIVTGKVACAGKLLAQCEMKIFIAE
jgi:predicted hotdog family 3-hydroxylacyl-ACP dehydratase